MVGGNQILGQIYNLDLNGGLPAGMTSVLTGSTIVTNKSNSVEYGGGSGSSTNFTEYISVTKRTFADNFTVTLIFKPVVTGAGISLLLNYDSTGYVYARFNSSTGVLTYGNSGAGDLTSTSALSFTNNQDILAIKLNWNRITTTFTASVEKVNQPTTKLTCSGVSSALPQIFRSRVCFHAGTTEIFSVSASSALSKEADVLFAGDSNTFDIINTDANRFVGRARNRATANDVDAIAWAGATTAMFVEILPELVRASPKNFIWMIGTNDGNQGVSLSTYSNNIDTVINALTPLGAKVYLLSILPNNQGWSANVPTWNAQLASKDNGANVFYIDGNTPMNNGSNNLKTGYGADGVHLSLAGVNAFWDEVIYPLVRTLLKI